MYGLSQISLSIVVKGFKDFCHQRLNLSSDGNKTFKNFKTSNLHLLSSRAALSNQFATRHMWRMAI